MSGRSRSGSTPGQYLGSKGQTMISPSTTSYTVVSSSRPSSQYLPFTPDWNEDLGSSLTAVDLMDQRRQQVILLNVGYKQ